MFASLLEVLIWRPCVQWTGDRGRSRGDAPLCEPQTIPLISVCDFVLLAVKLWDTETVLEQIKPVV
jgi:hypothetical protein